MTADMRENRAFSERLLKTLVCENIWGALREDTSEDMGCSERRHERKHGVNESRPGTHCVSLFPLSLSSAPPPLLP